MRPRATLKKREILRLKNDIEELFKAGKSVKAAPLKILYYAPSPKETSNERGSGETPTARAMFVVSKRAIKSAARRNRVKRCLREAYRSLKRDALLLLSQRCPSIHQIWFAFLFQAASSEAVSAKQMKAVLNEGIEKVVARLSREQSA